MRSAKAAARWAPARLRRLWNNMAREIITFQCSECKRKNYNKTKNKKTTTERLEMKKYCPFCRKHQTHKEIK